MEGLKKTTRKMRRKHKAGKINVNLIGFSTCQLKIFILNLQLIQLLQKRAFKLR